MNSAPSPRPWRIPEVGLIPTEIWSTDGAIVARGVSPLNAALIVDAVNNADSWRSAYINARTERNAFLLEREQLRANLAEALAHANECALDAAAEHAARARAVEEAQREANMERERLRDIVRRMMEKLAVLNAGYRLMLSEGPEDAEMADLCTRVDSLIREARAALGAGENPTGEGVGE